MKPVEHRTVLAEAVERSLAWLESLETLGEPPFHVLVWDNGSSDGTARQVEARHPDVLVHACDRNLGVASGRNAAARARGECVRP